MEIDDVIFNLIDVPPKEIKEGVQHPFWRDLESDNVKSAMLFCIINELRTAPIQEINGKECRTILARCQAYLTMIDLADTLSAQIEKVNVSSSRTPSEIEEFDFEEED